MRKIISFSIFVALLLSSALLISSCLLHQHTPGEPVIRNQILSTCTEEGRYDEVVYCTVCEEEISRERKYTPALGHNYVYEECTVCHDQEIKDSTQGLTFELNSDGKGYTLIGIGECTEKNITVGYYNSLPVTAIADYALFEIQSIETVHLGRTVVSVGAYAFNGCKSLEGVTMSEKTDSIEENAFAYCSALRSLTVNKHSVAKLASLDTSVNEAPAKATVPSIDDYEKVIHETSFFGCQSLFSLSIPYGIEAIGDSAFRELTKLEHLYLPNTVKYIGSSAFESCTSLKYVSFGSGIEYILDNAFAATRIDKIAVPTGTKYIGSSAFYNCNDAVSAYIPHTVEYIGENAFYQNGIKAFYCDYNSDYYTVVDGVLFTKDMKRLVAFPRAALEKDFDNKYEVPEGVEIISSSAFYYLWFDSLSLPASLKEIEATAFNGMRVSELTINAENPQFKIEDGALYTADGKTLVFYFASGNADVTLPDGLEVILPYAFFERSIKSLTLPSSMDIIEESAFVSCNIGHIALGDGLREIRSYAFDNTTFESIDIGSGVKTMGDYVFSEFLECSIALPSNVEEIGKMYYDQYRTLRIEDGSPCFKLIDRFLCSQDGKILYAIQFDYETDSNYDGIYEIVIPDCVEEIADGAIYWPGPCRVILHGNIKKAGEIYYSLDAGVSENNVFFVSKNLTSLNTRSIFCESYVVEEGNEVYSAKDGVLYSKDGKTLIAYPSNRSDPSFTIPEGVETIGSYAFSASNLRELIFASTIRNLEKYAIFCFNIERLVINEGLEVLGEYSLAQTKIMKGMEIVLPESLKKIDKHAFSFCRINKVIYNGSPMQRLLIDVEPYLNFHIATPEWEYLKKDPAS